MTRMRLRMWTTMVAVTGFFMLHAQERLRLDRMFERAEQAYDARRFSETIELLSQALRTSEAFFEAYPLRASAKEQLNDLDGALVDYSIYLEKFPDNVDALLGRAVIRYKLGFYDQAHDDLTTLLSLPSPRETNTLYLKKAPSVNDRNPVVATTQGAHRSHIYNYLGLVEMKRQHAARARVCFDSAIRLNPQEADYYVNRGLLRESLQDENAFVDYQHALRLNPQHTLALHNLRAWNAMQGHHISTEERLTRTIEEDPDILYPYLERAQERFRLGDFKGAFADYNRALSLDSLNEEIWLGRGLCLEKAGDLRAAFSDYTKAIDLNHNFAKAWLNRGNVLLEMERFADAVDDYSVALIYYPDYAYAWYNRAMAYYHLNRLREACDDLATARVYGMKIDERVNRAICEAPVR